MLSARAVTAEVMMTHADELHAAILRGFCIRPHRQRAQIKFHDLASFRIHNITRSGTYTCYILRGPFKKSDPRIIYQTSYIRNSQLKHRNYNWFQQKPAATL